MSAVLRKCLLLITVLQPLVAGSSSATSIVCIRSPESIVIAADSMLTIKTTAGFELSSRECKIFKTGDIFFALTGFYKDPSRGFNLHDLVADIISNDMTLSEATDIVEKTISERLRDELSKLKSESPELFNKYVKGRNGQLVKILLARYEDGVPKVAFLGFSGIAAGEISIRASRTQCPGDCKPQSVSVLYLTDKTAIDDFMKKGGKLDWLSPEKAARQLVELVIQAHTPGVGPPVDVLRIDGNGVEWVERKPECPDYQNIESNSRDFDW